MQLSPVLILTALLSAGALALLSHSVETRTHMNETPWIAMYAATSIGCSGDPLGSQVDLDKGTGPKAFARTDSTTNVKVYFGDAKCIVAYTSYTNSKVYWTDSSSSQMLICGTKQINVVAKTFNQHELGGRQTFCLTKDKDNEPEASLHIPWVKAEASEQC